MVHHVHDSVDSMVSAWSREIPALDATPLHVFSRISRLARHLDRARREVFAAHHLEGWEFDVISTLRRTGHPYALSPGALVVATLSTSGTMTHRIDRLAERGLVQRQPDPDDRRGVKVVLTEQGRELADAALGDLVGREQHHLAQLPAVQRDELTAALRALTLTFEEAPPP